MDMTSYIIGRKSAGGGSDITIDDVIAITGELDNLNTTDKSNLVNAINEVASAGGGEQIPTLVLDNPYTFSPGSSLTDSTMLNFFSTRITEMLTETPQNGLVLIKYNNSSKTELWSCKTDISTSTTQFNFYLVNTSEFNLGSAWDFVFAVRGSWGENVFTAKNIATFRNQITGLVYGNDVLKKDNTSSYTPTGDYNPATKKYVDNAISTAVGNINTILATLTTPSNGGA